MGITQWITAEQENSRVARDLLPDETSRIVAYSHYPSTWKLRKAQTVLGQNPRCSEHFCASLARGR